jgi:hypothetical protein
VGASKRRGDSEFYKRLVARRKDRKVTGTGMRHRHLSHRDYTLAAIDDVIGDGRRDAWERLRLAVIRRPAVREKVLRVCEARIQDPTAQRHHFWWHYVQGSRAGS